MLQTRLENVTARPLDRTGSNPGERQAQARVDLDAHPHGLKSVGPLLKALTTTHDFVRLVLLGAIGFFAAAETDIGWTASILVPVALGCALSLARLLTRLGLWPGPGAHGLPAVGADVVLAASAGFLFSALTSAVGGSFDVLVGNVLVGSLVASIFLEPTSGWRERGRRFAAFLVALATSTVLVGGGDLALLVAEAGFALLLAAACMTLEVKLSEARFGWQHARHEAEHDHLTGLLNRKGIERAFAELTGARAGQYLCAVYLDLDGFKNVNDRHGHTKADQLLRDVGPRIGECFRSSDPVGRIGGDEFVVLLRHDDISEIEQRAQHLIKSFTLPFSLGPTDVAFLSASIGIAVSEGRPESLEGILAAADEALYEAKSAGKSTWRVKLRSGAEHP